MANSRNKGNNNNSSNSSGEDSLLPKLHSPHRQRAMSFLYSISKRLGRRAASKNLIYNSQDDILRSSSTDSFSLSLDRGSSAEKHLLSSNIDMTSDGHSSRSSSGSDSSRASSSGSGNDENNLDATGCSYKQHRHSYEPTCYRSVSALGEHDVADDGDDDDSDKGDVDNHLDEHHGTKATAYKFSARSQLRGLNLNRISISTVSRVLQHISSSSSSSSTSVSTRSLSCNSTPLKLSKQKQQQQQQQQQNKNNDKKSASSDKSEPKKAAKPQPQQQRILRQPINYVYLKGMSGLPTRRVPRSSLCCSYGYR